MPRIKTEKLLRTCESQTAARLFIGFRGVLGNRSGITPLLRHQLDQHPNRDFHSGYLISSLDERPSGPKFYRQMHFEYLHPIIRFRNT